MRWLLLAVLVACGGSRTTNRPAEPAGYCKPSDPCWPSAAEWQQLRAAVGGRLVQPKPVMAPCITDATSEACAAASKTASNPFALQDDPGATQSTGWLDAWTAAPSTYAVEAHGAADVAAAVAFARAHRVRLVIKGTGHDYLGRSNAPDSLLVWTHAMRDISMHDAFMPRGCDAAEPAVSVGAGVRWVEAYREVTVKHKRYVQGGGCTSVGAAGGFTQGGGFGSWSKKFGTGAGNILEVEVVTANGGTVIANACQNQDLFWALRGGGGGTFGVVTRMTLRTHPLPSHFGFMFGKLSATSDAAYRELLAQFVTFYRERLANEAWGEQVGIGKNTLTLSMSFQGMSAEDAAKVWEPMRAWVAQRPDRFTIALVPFAMPADRMWDRAFIEERAKDALKSDDRAHVADQLFWWATNQGEVSHYWYTYQSRWLPLASFDQPAALAQALFEASREHGFDLHFNKGLGGGSPEAVQRNAGTAMHPMAAQAAALVIAASGEIRHPGVPGREPDRAEAEAEKAKITAAMAILRRATPASGAYVNEADYFEPDWQHAFWGDNYARLLAVKRQVDPDNIFTCHHCVGSELPRR